MSIQSLADKTVVVERPTTTQNDAGFYVEAFETWKIINARIQPLSAAELATMGREHTDVGIRLYCLPEGIQEPDRLIYDGRTYRIVGVRDIDEQGRLCTIDAIEEK